MSSFKAHWGKIAAATLFSAASAAASAAPVLTEEFDATGFGTDYNYIAPTFPTLDWMLSAPPPGTQTYTLWNDGQQTHSYWTSFAPQSGAGTSMLIANGAEDASKRFWYADISVVAGSQYTFSGWFRNLYVDSGATIQFDATGLSSVALGQVGPADQGWQQFTTTLIAPTTGTMTISLTDTNTSSSGNDFAADQFTVNVPEPSDLLMLGAGLSLIGLLARRRRTRA